MPINYISVGRDIAGYITQKTNKAEVLYDRHGIKALANSKNCLSEIVKDIFVNADSPSLTMSAREGKSHTILKMTTKDGVEIIDSREFIIPKEADVIAHTPNVKGKTSKLIMNRSDIQELLKDNSKFSEYIKSFLQGSKNPILEIATKDSEKYNLSAFVLKDGDVVLTQGAFSTGRDKYGRTIRKYHFNTGDEIASGFVGEGKKRIKVLPYLSKEKQEKYEILAPMLFTNRATNILRDFYGIERKRLNLGALADKYMLTKERCRQIIAKIITKMDNVKSMQSPELGVDVRRLKPYKYLSEDELDKFNVYRSKLLSQDEEERKLAVDVLEQLKLESKRRAALKTLDVIKRNEN